MLDSNLLMMLERRLMKFQDKKTNAKIKRKRTVLTTLTINVVHSTVNAASNEVIAVGRKLSSKLPDDLNMPELEDINIFEDSNEDVFGAEVDLNNLESTFQKLRSTSGIRACRESFEKEEPDLIHKIYLLEKMDSDSAYMVADEGFFVGYSLNSKEFRVFNSRTRIMEETLHIKFSKNTPNTMGSGPNWLFDIDALTKIMNYQPVVAGTQSNGNASTKDNNNASQARKEKEPNKDYILLPLWTVDPPFLQEPKSSQDAGFKPSNDV
nr:ribonuclease H-like domain-containing protein [Tanacetum cinerariifolium]